ncbi:hypothetical protein HSBAA_21320 [Vreelandella sulfidaeris]|uniref:CHASE2 domain-containing protein n=1 Tax=Vreelandella sulfidaeris TaxID=115553 RepID=A0A455U450_9GAMM|nr:hypothetical protein HSBAA_21320 [Halomonas sulfidaeris]
MPWYGPRGHFDYFSAADILKGRLDPGALAGKTLILGASAPGLMDLRSTPVGGIYPGPEINLSLLAGMLHQRIHAQPPWVLGFELVSLLALGVFMVLLYPRLNAPLLLVVSGDCFSRRWGQPVGVVSGTRVAYCGVIGIAGATDAVALSNELSA